MNHKNKKDHFWTTKWCFGNWSKNSFLTRMKSKNDWHWLFHQRRSQKTSDHPAKVFVFRNHFIKLQKTLLSTKLNILNERCNIIQQQLTSKTNLMGNKLTWFQSPTDFTSPLVKKIKKLHLQCRAYKQKFLQRMLLRNCPKFDEQLPSKGPLHWYTNF